MCACCAKYFDDQKGNFFQIDSDLYSANNHYVTICKSCCESYYLHLLDIVHGDERWAIHRIAQMLDLYVSDDMIDAVLAAPDGKNTIGRLFQKSHLKPNAGKSYTDTSLLLREQANAASIALDEQATPQDESEASEVVIDQRAVRIFGSGCEPADYAAMLEHYDSLASQFDTGDVVQNSLIKDLCQIKVLQQKAYVRGDMDTFDKATKLYQQTMKTSGLQPRQDNSDAFDDDKACFGVWKGQIEQYCPADIYKDKQMFADVDKVKEYFERFILRPVCNFFSGERHMDPEYSLTPEEMSDGSTQ